MRKLFYEAIFEETPHWEAPRVKSLLEGPILSTSRRPKFSQSRLQNDRRHAEKNPPKLRRTQRRKPRSHGNANA